MADDVITTDRTAPADAPQGVSAVEATPPPRSGGFGQRGPNHDEPVFVISVAAELADMHPQTLRSYEREGLITPARTSGNTRRYSQRDIDRLRFIRHLTQEEGLNLSGVRVVLDLGEKLEQARHKNRELEDMVARLADQIRDGKVRQPGGRHDIVPVGAREVEVHPTLRRRRPRPRAGTR